MSQFTFDDLRIRVAEFLSIAFYGTPGTSTAAVPTSDHNVDLVNRIVNDGYKQFLLEHDWMFMTPTAELTFVTETSGSVTTSGTGTFTDSVMTDTTGTHNGSSIRMQTSTGATFYTTVLTQTSSGVFTFADGNLVFTENDTYTIAAAPAIRGQAHRYLMPEDFGGEIIGRMTYAGPSGTPRLELRQVDDNTIRQLNSGNVTNSSEPQMIAFLPLTQDNPSDPARSEAMVWPTPIAQRTVVYKYRRYPVDLKCGQDRPISGVAHDMTLLAAIKAEAEKTRHDEVAVEGANYIKLLALSKKRDAAQRPKSMGMVTNPEGSSGGFPFFRGTVDSVNGESITF